MLLFLPMVLYSFLYVTESVIDLVYEVLNIITGWGVYLDVNIVQWFGFCFK